MIRLTLERLVLTVKGCRGALLVGHDGIPVEWIIVDECADVDELAASAARPLTAARDLAPALGGPLQSFLLTTGNLMCLARPAGDYFLLALLEPHADVAAATDEMVRGATALAADLATPGAMHTLATDGPAARG